jgi:transposase-like protein
VERDWLAQRLESGQSIEAIAREVGRHPSSVAYWVHKDGLASMHAVRHAPCGGIERGHLLELIDEGLSIRGIADRLGVSYATVRHWLRKHGLETRRSKRLKVVEAGPSEPLLLCPEHGVVPHVRGSDGYLRCRRCRTAAVVRRRARVRATLIAEAGGRCVRCGYDDHPSALQFHHLDRSTKAFNLRDGDTRSLSRMRDEALKCVLLCANCHAQVEAGVADVPVRSTADGNPSGIAQSDNIPG